jgi:hypothetical protein
VDKAVRVTSLQKIYYLSGTETFPFKSIINTLLTHPDRLQLPCALGHNRISKARESISLQSSICTKGHLYLLESRQWKAACSGKTASFGGSGGSARNYLGCIANALVSQRTRDLQTVWVREKKESYAPG